MKQQQIDLREGSKTDVRTQFAALAYRVKDGKLKFCLITSRRSGRWIVPKGWPMHGETPMEAAATEAFEEAGLRGKMHRRPVGVFSYYKVRSEDELPCVAIVYPMRVTKVLSRWPERKERTRKWFSRKKAAELISDRELAKIIEKFDPDAN